MNFTAHLYFKYFLEVYFYFSYQLLKIKLTEYLELRLIRTKNSCAFIRYNGNSSLNSGECQAFLGLREWRKLVGDIDLSGFCMVINYSQILFITFPIQKYEKNEFGDF